MCYPDANEPYKKFLNAYEQFKKDLHQELIYSKSINEKYIKVHESETAMSLIIYYQRRTLNILKVVVDNTIDPDRYGKDPVVIFAEDAALQAKLDSLQSVADMRTYMGEVLEIVNADQVIVALTYPNISNTSMRSK